MPGHNPDNLSCSNLGLRGEAHDAALEMTLERTARSTGGGASLANRVYRDDRPSWDDTMLSIAAAMSQRSTCLRLQAGAVIATADHKVVATGYNGAPHGLEHCTVLGCMVEGGHCVRAVHAEVNAVVQVARLGGPGLDGCTLYSTHRSCVRCAPILVQSGIRRVVYSKEYDSDLASGAVVDLLTRSGVQVEVRR
jgi:dCMP deaminase